MPQYYIYLISSLPVLYFSGKPPFSPEVFLARCNNLIPGQDQRLLAYILSTDTFIFEGEQEILKRLRAFEILLGNEIARFRAGRKKVDAQPFLREGELPTAALSQAVPNAFRNPSLREAERAIDALRWQYLEELCQGHFFDREVLIVYALKLKILTRWEKINLAEGAKALAEALT